MLKLESVEYILERMHQSVHSTIKAKAVQNQATHIVLATNMQMDSLSFGGCTVLCVGPQCMYRTVEDCEGKWLKDQPSQHQYFTHYARVPAEWHDRSL